MTLAEIESRLKTWKRLHRYLMGAYKDLHGLTGADADSALMQPVFDLWNAYTVAVGELVGDNVGWMEWYEIDCDMGKHPKEARTPGGRDIKVKTLAQLAKVIMTSARNP